MPLFVSSTFGEKQVVNSSTIRNTPSVLVLFHRPTSATTGFFNTQITPTNVNNTGSMDQVLPSLFITRYVASSPSLSVFTAVYSALITSLRFCSIFNARTEPLYEQNHVAFVLSVCRRSGILSYSRPQEAKDCTTGPFKVRIGIAAHLRRWFDVEGLEGPSALETPSPSCEGCPFTEQMANFFDAGAC